MVTYPNPQEGGQEPGQLGRATYPPSNPKQASVAPHGNSSPHPFTVKGYGSLAAVLTAAYDQSAKGKGHERHNISGGQAFTEQPIMEIARRVGLGYPAGQAMKKTQEAMGMLANGRPDAARAEILGAIVYLAALHHLIGEDVAPK